SLIGERSRKSRRVVSTFTPMDIEASNEGGNTRLPNTKDHIHLRPLKCPRCPYSCINSNLLDAHMRMHGDEKKMHKFRCGDCNYASKYCYALDLHLKKYGHARDNPADTPKEADLRN
ncbi:hypothetical protein PENTCL1PPCAC_9149, partial [Pristionchus entomophagus]